MIGSHSLAESTGTIFDVADAVKRGGLKAPDLSVVGVSPRKGAPGYVMVECTECGGRSANGVAYHKRGCATTLGGWSEAQRQGIEVIVARERREAITEYEQQWEWIEEVDMKTPVRKGLQARPTATHRDRSKYQRRTNVNIPAEEDIEFDACPDCGSLLLAQL